MYSIIRSKTFVALCGFALFATSLVGCKDNDDAYNKPNLQLSEVVENNTLMANAEGFSRQLTFTTNRRWTATSPEWIDVSPNKGEPGTHTVTVKALSNSGAERIGNIVFNFGYQQELNLKLQQAAGQGNTPDAPKPLAGMPLAEVIKKYYKEGVVTTINDEVQFQGSVISDRSKGNTQPKNLHLQGEGAGIIVRFQKNHAFDLGALVDVKIKGAKIQRYNGGALQIELSSDSQAVATGETRIIEPTKATMQDIYEGKYENMLVALDDVQFAKAGGDYVGNKSYFHTITDCVTKPSDPNMGELSVSISNYATEFKGQKVSDKRGRIVGIVAHNTSKEGKKFRNLIPRSLSDIQLTAERCEATNTPPANNSEGDKPNPPAGGGNDNPAPPTGGGENQPQPSEHPIITAYVEGPSGNEKYIQIWNPTDKAIDLSKYTLQLEVYTNANAKGKGTNPQIGELKGTLDANAVIVFKHKDAKGYKGESTAINVCSFNGNDNIALFCEGTMIDVIGTWGEVWLTPDKKGGGADVTLKRKANIKTGKKVFDINEWESTPTPAEDSFSFLNARP